jgi:hypothetical protein
MQEEKAHAEQLVGELEGLRREYERSERDLQALSMQTQRAQQLQERSTLQLSGAKDELAAVQVGHSQFGYRSWVARLISPMCCALMASSMLAGRGCAWAGFG